METNIDPHLQEEESTVGLFEELIEAQVDPSESSRVVKISKGLKGELAQHFTKLLCQNHDMFAWTHADMVRIHPKVIWHQLNINP